MSKSIVDVINRRFVSGNSVCVERTHIKAAEWEGLKAEMFAANREARVLGEALDNLLYASEHSSESHYYSEQHGPDPWDAARALRNRKPPVELQCPCDHKWRSEEIESACPECNPPYQGPGS